MSVNLLFEPNQANLYCSSIQTGQIFTPNSYAEYFLSQNVTVASSSYTSVNLGIAMPMSFTIGSTSLVTLTAGNGTATFSVLQSGDYLITGCFGWGGYGGSVTVGFVSNAMTVANDPTNPLYYLWDQRIFAFSGTSNARTFYCKLVAGDTIVFSAYQHDNSPLTVLGGLYNSYVQFYLL